LLKEYSAAAKQALLPYGIQVRKAVNGRDNGDLFWLPDRPIEQTPILFGGRTRTYSSILKDWLMAVCISATLTTKIQNAQFGSRF